MSQEIYTGKSAEHNLHQLILDERLDQDILNYILPDRKPHSWESRFWDYKKEAPDTSGRNAESPTRSIMELIKDVVAFHNSFGGYIVFGIDEKLSDPVIGCKNLGASGFTIDKFNQQVLAYTKADIICKFRSFNVAVQGSELLVGILLVPMRAERAPIVRMYKGAPEDGKKEPSFRKGDIFARINDACLKVQNNIQYLQFICSARKCEPNAMQRRAENNLPAKDPNLVQFVGRAEYLLQLWSWVTTQSTPVKVLTALGGMGKTAIAYEFCTQLISNPTAAIERVIWLSAKTRSFSAISGKWFQVTRTDFVTPTEFFARLASELGSTDKEILEAETIEELLDIVLYGLNQLP